MIKSLATGNGFSLQPPPFPELGGRTDSSGTIRKAPLSLSSLSKFQQSQELCDRDRDREHIHTPCSKSLGRRSARQKGQSPSSWEAIASIHWTAWARFHSLTEPDVLSTIPHILSYPTPFLPYRKSLLFIHKHRFEHWSSEVH